MKIKYETDLEEAKKIKELGYDFSPVCEKFIDPEFETIFIRTRDDYFQQIKTPEEVTGYENWFADIRERKRLIPTIPYPILEACLPGHVMRYHNWNYCVKAYLNYPETQIMGMDYEFNFDQLVEAFLWCNKEYPKETRAKFEELINDN